MDLSDEQKLMLTYEYVNIYFLCWQIHHTIFHEILFEKLQIILNVIKEIVSGILTVAELFLQI